MSSIIRSKLVWLALVAIVVGAISTPFKSVRADAYEKGTVLFLNIGVQYEYTVTGKGIQDKGVVTTTPAEEKYPIGLYTYQINRVDGVTETGQFTLTTGELVVVSGSTVRVSMSSRYNTTVMQVQSNGIVQGQGVVQPGSAYVQTTNQVQVSQVTSQDAINGIAPLLPTPKPISGAIAAGNTTGGSNGVTINSGVRLGSTTPVPQQAGVAQVVPTFGLGTVVCIQSAQKYIECNQANTRLVVGVIDANGALAVQGAQQIKVIGPVKPGDLLVTSQVPGYAMANNSAAFGTAIGRAQAGFSGQYGIIPATIGK